MTLELTRKCDVFGTTKDVRRYRVVVTCLAEDDDVPLDTSVLADVRKDMCRSALARFQRFMERAIAPPSKAATDAKQEPEVVASTVS